ncbi:uncharacterized protein LOC108887504 isoform X2 [Lates calcarifer]|uniref:Uncharacterized protein LOC108887504 isoform X2 n=1 Tax=Lates calcarifer TaxID=8187 RepID=A0AAJ8B8F0_LATCA|nr:uncharacterized protein LOC108887504 isoform X2 [Lates calcarifer]
MAEFRWIKVSLLMIQLLQFTAAEQFTFFTVRDGEVTLPCNRVTDKQDQCNSVTWSLSGSKPSGPVELILYGKINKNATSKSDRLNLTENCSLVIKNVTAEDVGQYTCQLKSRQHQVYLSVVSMTEQKSRDQVTLNCSVRTYDHCRHTVKWLYEGKDVNNNKDIRTSQSGCSANVTFQPSLTEKSKYPEFFKCEVTDGYNRQQFTLSSQSSGGDGTAATTAGKPATESTPPTTTRRGKPATESTPATTEATTTSSTPVTKSSSTTESTPTTTSTPATTTAPPAASTGLWGLIVLPVVLAALIVVLLIRRKRTKGNKPHVDTDTADPEDGVSYASISYTKKTNRKARARGNDGDDDEGDAVAYTTVKVPSSSAGASADPSNLYATVNKPEKTQG